MRQVSVVHYEIMCIYYLTTLKCFSILLQGAASAAEAPELRDRTLYAGRQCADAYRSLLEQVHNVSITQH